MKNIINKHKSIIFLNGALPNKKLISLLDTNVPIVAADGATAVTNQFANACTAGNSLVAYSAQVVSGNVYLQGTATNNSTIIRLHKNYQAI